jgi:phospholipid/cholesterol/gamma-HCH transport system ATP-binding protein
VERETHSGEAQTAVRDAVRELPTAMSSEGELLRRAATNLLALTDELSQAMARHIHEQVPELGDVSDPAAVEATFRSSQSNIRELCVMLRAGIPATAHETPSDALDYARVFRARGVGFTSLARGYEHGVSMFVPVIATELMRHTSDPVVLERIAGELRTFVWRYIDRVLERLGEEYEITRERRPGPEDPVWSDPTSIEAGASFAREYAERSLPGQSAFAREQAERSLEMFCEAIEAGGRHVDLASRLAVAGTTIRIDLADEPDLGVTVQLDEERVGLDPPGASAEAEMYIASIDLERLFSHDFNLAMAIARGRVRVSGPVRKFLRVIPVIRNLPVADLDDASASSDSPDVRLPEGEDEKAFDPATRQVLDQAHAYALHQGAMVYDEEKPGYFWSIECDNVHKAFGTNVVLNGLTVGIPEGMITVILGPSGTGKSVLISHLIGLMFPDIGEVYVHGNNVADLRMSQLLLLRQKFGILFQDGALFGSMNVYDNVAFPLRQHTDKSEDEIAAIVNRRLAEVGLEQAWNRSPGELSGGMKKRAGFARALVLNPDIVMFDEPDSGLDPVRTALLCELIEKVHAENGGTYIVITHNIAAARQIAEYIVVLWKGRIVQSGDKDDMLTSPNPFVRQFLAGRPRGPLGME